MLRFAHWFPTCLIVAVAATPAFAQGTASASTDPTSTSSTPATHSSTSSGAAGTTTTGATSAAAPADPQAGQPAASTPTSPLAIHVGDADLLIGGFMDATAVMRSTNPGTGLGTSFGTIPFSNTPAGSLSETRLSAQNSRVTLAATSHVGDASIKGYLEADFLGAAATNQFVTSNSATLRMRLYWVQATTGKFEFLAGQSWSLLTPNRTGVSPNPGDLFYTQVVDTNYVAGLTWGRTDQFRFSFHPSKTVSAAVSIENPEQYVGTAVTLPAAFTGAEVDNGSNTATPNLYPDIIGKLSLDPQTGKTHQHVEVAGLVRGFKTFDVPTAKTFTKTGTGGSVAAVVEPVRTFHLVATGFFSSGGGRYIGNTNLPDFIVNSDSSISLVKTRSVIAGIEEQATPKLLVYGYYSLARADALTATDTSGKPIGFGITAANSANQKIDEATVGVTQVFFKDPKVGAMQIMVQYSYAKRTPFSVASGAPATAKANMVFVNVRYVLP